MLTYHDYHIRESSRQQDTYMSFPRNAGLLLILATFSLARTIRFSSRFHWKTPSLNKTCNKMRTFMSCTLSVTFPFASHSPSAAVHHQSVNSYLRSFTRPIWMHCVTKGKKKEATCFSFAAKIRKSARQREARASYFQVNCLAKDKSAHMICSQVNKKINSTIYEWT